MKVKVIMKRYGSDIDKMAMSRQLVKDHRVEKKSVSCLNLSHVYKILTDMFCPRFNKNLNNR